MMHFHQLTVTDIAKETAECVSIAFGIPSEKTDLFSYLPGQYVTLRFNIDGQELRRSYSICSSPLDNELRIAIKKVKEGRISGFINDVLKKGDSIEVMPPTGNFHTPINASNKKNYVLFAGGSGVTPMVSIIKTVLKAEPNSTIILFYGNQDESSIIFKNELEELVAGNSSRFKMYHVLDRPPVGTAELFTGIMTEQKVISLVENFVGLNLDNEFFICGPTPMMQNVEKTLAALQVPKQKVHLEYFSAPVDKTAATVTSSKACKATIICDGDEIEVMMNPGESILDAALRVNIDAPYACTEGSCCTCRAKLTEGKVDMRVNYALLDAEVAQGYVLTCQSFPTTESIVVNYDQGR